ncbi:DUF4265 domain-containing protein [Actinokineospora sp. PR83]|uniref:DUF4265 domain-containing protein n=1 Tax=Actinokineospora sp. PR83 TaxID=2884908 RepID=UPI001F3E86DD|nr:DUF4265 domain-containing protein [Actinokineospora sp. PR83]MCG8920240.1 DUF4265 domain-containing protein [Actinokineospora sp. PR83]
MTDTEGFLKVVFDLPEDTASHACAGSELLWVEKTAVRAEFQVRNTPFYVKGIAWGDTIKARLDSERREIVFDGFVAESGHSTVRLVILDDEAWEAVEALLEGRGCSWEVFSTGVLWAVDVPPEVDYPSLRTDLLRLHEAGKIGIQEAALATPHRPGT